MSELELYKFDELVKLVSKLQKDLEAITVISVIAFTGVIVICLCIIFLITSGSRFDQ